MTRKTVLISLALLLPLFATGAQLRPYGLTTDLIGRTDVVYSKGYPVDITLPQMSLAKGDYQYAAIATPHPRFSWIVDGGEAQDVLQKAYRIRLYKIARMAPVAPAKGAKQYDYPMPVEQRSLVWDSGRVESSGSTGVKYRGAELEGDSIYAWEIKTWDNLGRESEWSEPKLFKTASELSDDAVSIEPLVKDDLHPESVALLPDGSVFADFGRDAFGQVSLSLSCEAPSRIVLHLGERLKDGRVDREPFGTCRYRRIELSLTPGTHTYTPVILPDWRNTHGDAVLMPAYIGEVMPFRYLEIEGLSVSGEQLEALKGSIVRSYVHHPFDPAPAFRSSDEVLNALWELCSYSMEATSFIGYHIDGDRERIPYECDALINQLCVYGVDRVYSLSRRTIVHLLDHPTWPTEWILQTVLMAWYDYLYTGDTRLLEAQYELLCSHTLSALRQPCGLVSTRVAQQDGAFLASIRREQAIRDIVDWPQGRGSFGLPGSSPGEADFFEFGDYNAVVNAYHYATLRCMAEIAYALARDQEASEWKMDAGRFKMLYNKSFLDRKEGLYRDVPGGAHSALHSNMFPLAFGLAPEKKAGGIADWLAGRGMVCSIANARFLLDALYEAGRGDAAYGLLSATHDRSWYNTVLLGSTMTLEAWDDKYKGNQDWNHAWGGAPADLLPHRFVGVEPLEAGWKEIRVKPQVASVTHVETSVPSPRGGIDVVIDNTPGRFRLELDIPANVVARVYVPVPKGFKGALLMNGEDVKTVRDASGLFLIAEGVGSGHKVFYVR